MDRRRRVGVGRYAKCRHGRLSGRPSARPLALLERKSYQQASNLEERVAGLDSSESSSVSKSIHSKANSTIARWEKGYACDQMFRVLFGLAKVQTEKEEWKTHIIRIQPIHVCIVASRIPDPAGPIISNPT